jgi:glyoxylase-like metal-dependent hydrolase (beta-lactamase superfamily II)
MRRPARHDAAMVKPALAVVCAAIAMATPDAPPRFTMQALADGVYAAIRQEPVGFGVDANNLFVIDDEGVVVVDSNFGATSTREVLTALRAITDRPVTHVINTHPHDDHVLGNQVYRDAFPRAAFIAHAFTRDYLPGRGLAARQRQVATLPGFKAQLERMLAEGQTSSGRALTEEERAGYASDVGLIRRYLADARSFDVVLPTLAVSDRLTLYRSGHEIEILFSGGGHTAGDLVVHLPRQRIVATGDLVVAPVPLVGSDQSHIGAWIASLEAIVALAPLTIVPGHGPVMHDLGYVRRMTRLFREVQAQTAAAVARGDTLEQARRHVDLSLLEREFAGDSALRLSLFRHYVTGPAVAAAFAERP